MSIVLAPIDIVGAAGAALILLGFYRTSIGKWTNKSFWYELDNMAGAGLLVIYNLNRKAYVSLVLDIVWVMVAIMGITSIAERRQRTHKTRRVKK